MSAPVDHAVFSWDMARPQLRKDLKFHFQLVEGKPAYVIEDRANRGYHQIGVPEYRFLSSLNGTKAAARLLSEASNGRDALSESEVESLLRWSVDNHLLQNAHADQADRRSAHTEDQASSKKSKQLMRFFYFKLPLGSPEQILRPFTRLLGWTLSPWALLLAAGAACYGVYLAISSFPLLMEASSRALLPENWLLLIGTSIVLKLFHELWHGIATQKFGGVVPEWGLQLILWISPLTYVDASSSWGFPHRWQRITVAGAGMYVELMLAIGALHVWTTSGPGMVKEIAFNLMVSASLVTVIFNANPLMRFDGYYIFCDLFDLRNLSQRGQQAFAWLNRRVFLGTRQQSIPPALRPRFLTLVTYGAAAWIWRILITVGILAMAANIFHGVGLVVLLLSGAIFLASILHSAFRFFDPNSMSESIPWGSASWRIGLAACAAGAALIWIPVNPSTPGLAVVEYPGKAVLRAETPGFVKSIRCADGAVVSKGQLLLALHNEEEVSRLRLLETELDLSLAKARIYYLKDKLDQWQLEQQTSQGLREKVGVQRKRVEALEVRAPIEGTVNAPDLAHQQGTYYETGTPLLTLIPDAPPQFLISMRQEDFRRIASDLSTDPEPFRIRLPGHADDLIARLNRAESKATLAIPSPVLASSAGGPLAVRGISQKETATQQSGLARGAGRSESLNYFNSIRPEIERDNLELLQPRFTLYASATDTSDLKEGEWGYSRYEGFEEEALGRWLWRGLRTYLEKRFLPSES
ncbi:MAG: hypothetical protein WBE58_03055 [Verrucomicrobiales bacterium]